MVSNGRRAPDFLYIGAAKAGSSWIYELLREHPGIFVPPAKDIQFFDHHFDKGAEWYLSFFSAARDDQVAGELSHDYFFDATYAERIHGLLPHCKLLACLRNPVDRIVSHYFYGRTVFVGNDVSIDEFALTDKARRGSDYYNNLKPFYALFPSANIKILLFDDLRNDPEAFCRSIYQFLGVESGFKPASLLVPARAARNARREWLGHLMYRGAKFLRGMGLPNIVGNVKRNAMFNRLVFTPSNAKPFVSPETRRRIHEYFVGDFDNLSRLIGRELPESWYDVS